MSLKLHGENGITYAFFNELDKAGKVKDFLDSIELLNNKKIKVDGISDEVEIHLFPSFGRRDGFGEPDVIILTDRFYILLEVKTKTFEKAMNGKVKKADVVHQNGDTTSITYQLERFYSLGKTLSEKYQGKKLEEGDEIRGRFIVSDIKSERGDRKTKVNRGIKEHINRMIKLEDNYYVVCLTNDSNLPKEYNRYIEDADRYLQNESSKDQLEYEKFGWIGFDKIREYAQDHNFKLTRDALDMLSMLK